MKTMSPGRSPMPHITRAWLLAITGQSSRPMAKTVGRPVVPDVPWMWWISVSGTQRYSPKGSFSACEARSSALVVTGTRSKSSKLLTWSGCTPASSHFLW